LGAAFICTDLKIQIRPRQSHAKYLNNWLSVLENDYRYLPEAISFAVNAMEWLYIYTKVKDIGKKTFDRISPSKELSELLGV